MSRKDVPKQEILSKNDKGTAGMSLLMKFELRKHLRRNQLVQSSAMLTSTAHLLKLDPYGDDHHLPRPKITRAQQTPPTPNPAEKVTKEQSHL